MRSAITPIPRSYRAPSRGRCIAATGARSPRAPDGSPTPCVGSASARSERIATLAWNHNRHLEIYFGVTCSGAVLHTVNPRLFPEQVRFIIDDAEASYVFFDTDIRRTGRSSSRPAAERARLRRAVRRARRCQHRCAEPAVLRGPAGRRERRIMRGRSSTRIPHRRCATHRAPPAIPRACCKATARGAAQLRTDGGRHDGDLGARNRCCCARRCSM